MLHGTDLGNTRDAGPNADEVALLARAGLDNTTVVDAMTTPIRYWALPLGISVGNDATFLALDEDLRVDVHAVFAPRARRVR